MTRPQGLPGTAEIGCTTYPVIRDRDGLYHWQSRSGHWYCPPRREGQTKLDERFIPADVRAHVEACPHDLICDTEADCTRLLSADLATWGDQ